MEQLNKINTFLEIPIIQTGNYYLDITVRYYWSWNISVWDYYSESDRWETDMTSVVNWVTDGDTFNLTSGDKVRLADIDAPEIGKNGYLNAKNFLISLIYNKTVYLDIDDLSRTDQYGRLICVAFVDYNSTHVTNVNKALLVENVAVITDYTNNEFNPSTWSLYVPIIEIQ